MLPAIGERAVAGDGAIGEAGPVHPARNRVDRHVRRDVGGVMVGAEGVRPEGRIVGQPVVGEGKLADEVRHVEIAEMFAHRCAAERAVGVLVDRLRAGKVGIVEIGLVRQHVAAVMVEPDHDVVVARRQLVQKDAARIEVIDPGVPDREERRDRLDRRMAGTGEETGGRAEIGNPGRADGAVRPGLGDDPVGDLAEILALGGRAETVAGAEAGAGAAHVDHHHRIAARHEGVAVACRVGAGLGVGGGPVPQREPAVIGRQDQDGGKAVRASGPFRQVDVGGDPAAIAHLDIAGGRPGRQRELRGALVPIARRRLSPGVTFRIAIRHRNSVRASQGGQRTGPVPCVNFDLRKISCAKRME